MSKVCHFERLVSRSVMSITLLLFTTIVVSPVSLSAMPREVIGTAVEDITETEATEIFAALSEEASLQEESVLGELGTSGTEMAVVATPATPAAAKAAFWAGVAAGVVVAAMWDFVQWGDHYVEEGSEIIEAGAENDYMEANTSEFDPHEQWEQEQNQAEHQEEWVEGAYKEGLYTTSGDLEGGLVLKGDLLNY